MEEIQKQVHEKMCVGTLPGHELLKLGAGQVETGPVSVSHRFVFRRSQVGQQGGHLVKRSPAYGLVVPGNQIIKNHFIIEIIQQNTVLHQILHPDLLLERYWPILSWLFHSRRWRASTLPSLIKDRLWLTESLGGESDAMSKKNLWWTEEGTNLLYRQKVHIRHLKILCGAVEQCCHQWCLFFVYNVLPGILHRTAAAIKHSNL